MLDGGIPRPSVDLILNVVCSHFRWPVALVLEKKRRHSSAIVRRYAARLMEGFREMSVVEIGHALRIDKANAHRHLNGRIDRDLLHALRDRVLAADKERRTTAVRSEAA